MANQCRRNCFQNTFGKFINPSIKTKWVGTVRCKGFCKCLIALSIKGTRQRYAGILSIPYVDVFPFVSGWKCWCHHFRGWHWWRTWLHQCGSVNIDIYILVNCFQHIRVFQKYKNRWHYVFGTWTHIYLG